LISLDLLAVSRGSKNLLIRHQKSPVPVFSHAGTFTRNVEWLLQALSFFYDTIISNGIVAVLSLGPHHDKAASVLSGTNVDIKRLVLIKENIEPLYDCHKTSVWSVDDVFRESEYNVILANCRAAIILIEDVMAALRHYCRERAKAAERLMEYEDPAWSNSKKYSFYPSENLASTGTMGIDPYAQARSVAAEMLLNKNRRKLPSEVKKAARIFSIETLAFAMYKTGVFAALKHIEGKADVQKHGHENDDTAIPNDVLLKAVERSRMCISTFNNHLDDNIEKSIKAAADFTSGKAIKSLLAS